MIILAITAALASGLAIPFSARILTPSHLKISMVSTVRAATTDTTGSDVQPVASTPSVSDTLVRSWPWYLTRAAGLASALFLFLLALSGIGLVTGYTVRIFDPVSAWTIHRSLGIGLIGSVLLHIVSLLIDKVLPFTLAEVLVPFVSTYKQVAFAGIALGSLPVALGIGTLYLLVPILYTSLFSSEAKPRQWKLIHYFSYIVTIFVFFHALALGTDLATPWVRTTVIFLGVILLIGGVGRISRTGSVKRN